MSKEQYEAKRTNLLAKLRKAGMKSPSKVFPKLGPDSWENQLDVMQSNVYALSEKK